MVIPIALFSRSAPGCNSVDRTGEHAAETAWTNEHMAVGAAWASSAPGKEEADSDDKHCHLPQVGRVPSSSQKLVSLSIQAADGERVVPYLDVSSYPIIPIATRLRTAYHLHPVMQQLPPSTPSQYTGHAWR